MSDDEHYRAFKHIQESISPAEGVINEMTPTEVEQALVDEGYNTSELKERVHDAKSRFAGRYALMLARRQRKESVTTSIDSSIDVPNSKSAIIRAFEVKYGDTMPMAARNYREASYEELRILYTDLMEGELPESESCE